MEHIHSEVKQCPLDAELQVKIQNNLNYLYKKIKFDIEQTKLRKEKATIFSKVASRLKNMLSGSVSTKDSSWR
jgi:hypothetical protein